MKIFLTGATGYIGSAVAEALKRANHAVIGLARTDEKARSLEARGIHAYRGDLSDSNSLASAVKDSDGVIHAGFTNDANASKADQDAVRAILDLLKNSGKPFIYTSGVWVMGNTDGKVADETKPLDPTPLVTWRVEFEPNVLAAAKQNIRAIVIRPALVYGHGKGLCSLFVSSAREHGAAQYIGSGENHWTFVHVEDLAELYRLALEKASAGNVFLGAHGPSVLMRQAAEAASQGAGAGGRTQSVTLEEARKQFGPMADALVLDQQVSGEKAKKTLGWSPKRDDILDDLREGSYPLN